MNTPTTCSSPHKTTLWEGHQALAMRVVNDYCFRSELREDAVQEVSLALWEAIQDWDSSMEDTFAHYAWLLMRRKLLHYLVNKAADRPRLSRPEQKVLKRIRGYLTAGQMLTCQIIDQLGAQEKISRFRMLQIVGYWYHSCLSLSASTFTEISESISDESDLDEDARLKILDNALQALPEREKDIILARFLSDPRKTLVELSALLGVSVERVRQLEANALKKLRVSIADSEEHM